MDIEQIKYFHSKGKMPDWVYYQINGKSAQSNYVEQKKKMLDEIRERELEKRQEEEIEKKVNECIEAALDKLFKNFK